MYQGFIQLSDDSYIEITTRLYNGEEKVVLAFRGIKDDATPALASVIIDDPELDDLIEELNGVRSRVKAQGPQ